MSRGTVGSSPRERTPLDCSTLGDSSVLRYELIQPCPFLKLHRRTGKGMAEGNGIEPIATAQGGGRPRGPSARRDLRGAHEALSLRRPPRDEPWRCGISPSTPRATGKAFPHESPQ